MWQWVPDATEVHASWVQGNAVEVQGWVVEPSGKAAHGGNSQSQRRRCNNSVVYRAASPAIVQRLVLTSPYCR